MRRSPHAHPAAMLFILVAWPGWCHAAELPKVLFFSDPQRSDNHIIRRAKPDVLAPAERHFLQMTKGVFDVKVTQDAGEAARAKLKSYDALVFFTALNPPVDKKGLVEWVKEGGGFVGIHSTANTYVRYAPFVDMLGARFRARPWRTKKQPLVKARVLVRDAKHPAARPFIKAPAIEDDIYLFGNFDLKKIDVLLSLDPASLDMTKVRQKDKVMPVAWTKTYGAGRVFYTSLGDSEQMWKDARYRNHLLEAVNWAKVSTR